jgi:hypothetical protein
MQRFFRGLALAAAAGVFWGCGDDPLAEGAGGVAKLVANPVAIFIAQGDTRTVIVEALDAQGGSRQATFEITDVGAGITAEIDPSFTPVFDPDADSPEADSLIPPTSPTRVRILVTGDDLVSSEFTVSAGGQSVTVDVRVTPVALAATFSSNTPAWGEVVTMTAPSGAAFAADAEISFATGAADPLITERDPAGGFIRFIPAPGTTGVATVSGVFLSFAPGAGEFTLQTIETVTTDPVDAVPVDISDATPESGDAITITTAAPFAFDGDTEVLTPGGHALPVTGVSPDGLTLTFEALGGDGTFAVSGVLFDPIPGLLLDLPMDEPVTVSSPFTGQNDPGTAPTIPLPAAVGDSVIVYDIGLAGGEWIYAIDGTAGERFEYRFSWAGTGVDPDIDFGVVNPAFTAFVASAGTAALPEVTSYTFASTDTYFVYAFIYDGAAPEFVKLVIKQIAP